MKHKHNNWFWGIFFVLAAVFVVVSQVTSFTTIGFWSILAAVVLAAICIQSLVHLNYFGVFLPLALAYIIFQNPLSLYAISPWLLILAAVLLSIGFHTIFRRRPKYTRCWDRRGQPRKCPHRRGCGRQQPLPEGQVRLLQQVSARRQSEVGSVPLQFWHP